MMATSTTNETTTATAAAPLKSVLSMFEANIANSRNSNSRSFLTNVALNKERRSSLTAASTSTISSPSRRSHRRASWCSGSNRDVMKQQHQQQQQTLQHQGEQGNNDTEAHSPLVKRMSTSTASTASTSTNSSSSATIEETNEMVPLSPERQHQQRQTVDVFIRGSVGKTKAMFETMASKRFNEETCYCSSRQPPLPKARVSRRSSLGPGVQVDDFYPQQQEHQEQDQQLAQHQSHLQEEHRMPQEVFQKMRQFWCAASTKVRNEPAPARYPSRWNTMRVQPQTVRDIALTAATEAASMLSSSGSSGDHGTRTSVGGGETEDEEAPSSTLNSSSPSSIPTTETGGKATTTPSVPPPRPVYHRSGSMGSINSSCRSLCVYDGANLYLSLPQGCMVFKPSEIDGNHTSTNQSLNNSNSLLDDAGADHTPQRPSRNGSLCSHGSTTLGSISRTLSRRRSSLGASTFLSRNSSISSISTVVVPPRRVRFSDEDEVFIFEIDDIGSVFSEDGLELAQDFEQVLWETGGHPHDAGPRQVRRQSSGGNNWQYVGFVEEVTLPQDFMGFGGVAMKGDSMPRPQSRRTSLDHAVASSSSSSSLLDNLDKAPHSVARRSSMDGNNTMLSSGSDDDEESMFDEDDDFLLPPPPMTRDFSPRRATRRGSMESDIISPSSPTRGDVSPRRAMRRGSIEVPSSIPSRRRGEDVSPRRATRRLSIDDGGAMCVLTAPCLSQEPDATTVCTTGSDSRADVHRQGSDSTCTSVLSTAQTDPSPIGADGETTPRLSNKTKKQPSAKQTRRASTGDELIAQKSDMTSPPSSPTASPKRTKNCTKVKASSPTITPKSPKSPKSPTRTSSTTCTVASPRNNTSEKPVINKVNRRNSTGGDIRPNKLRGFSFDDDDGTAQAMAEVCAALKAESESLDETHKKKKIKKIKASKGSSSHKASSSKASHVSSFSPLLSNPSSSKSYSGPTVKIPKHAFPSFFPVPIPVKTPTNTSKQAQLQAPTRTSSKDTDDTCTKISKEGQRHKSTAQGRTTPATPEVSESTLDITCRSEDETDSFPVEMGMTKSDSQRYLNCSTQSLSRKKSANHQYNKHAHQNLASVVSARPDFVRGYSFRDSHGDDSSSSSSSEEDSIFVDFCDDASAMSLVSAASSVQSLRATAMRGQSFVRNRA